MKKKLFISHATEDKELFVRPLARALRETFDVWYDEYSLVAGMSLLEEISKGIAATDYGIVVLSPNFFAKKWPQTELNGLFALEEKNRKVIIPIWKDVTEQEVKKYSPIIADKYALKASDGVRTVVSEITTAVTAFDRGKEVQGGSAAAKRLSSALARRAEAVSSADKLQSAAGIALVGKAAQQVIQQLIETVNGLPKNPLERGNATVDTPSLTDRHSYVNVCTGQLCLRIEYRTDLVIDACCRRLKCVIFSGRIGRFGEYKGADVRQSEDYKPYITVDNAVAWTDEEGNKLTADELLERWLDRYAEELEPGE